MSSCKNVGDDFLNKFYECEPDATTVCLEYGPYMN